MGEQDRQRRVYLGLPAFNEAAAISSLFRRVQNSRKQIQDASLASDLRVIFYDDGSSDETADQVRSCHGELDVYLLTPPCNGGLGTALQGIISFFLEVSDDQDVLVIMDCDDTHDPGQITDLLTRMDAENEHVVIASRYRKGATISGVPWNRQILSLGFAGLVKAILPIRGIRDYSCGYRAYAKAPLSHASSEGGFHLAETGFSAMPEILVRLRGSGWSFGEIPLELAYDRRETESKMRAWRNTRRLLRCVVSWRFASPGGDDSTSSLEPVLSRVRVEHLEPGPTDF